MKGIVFTEFIEHVEAQFGQDLADQLLDDTPLSSGGVYTAVGTYDHQELITLVVELSKHLDIEASALVASFGKYLFQRFFKIYPEMFEGVENAFDFLLSVENNIHVEVRKLYDHADLPSFEYEHPTEGRLVMTYRSARPFADLAEGLIAACVEHYEEPISVAREDIPHEDLNCSRFVLTRLEV